MRVNMEWTLKGGIQHMISQQFVIKIVHANIFIIVGCTIEKVDEIIIQTVYEFHL